MDTAYIYTLSDPRDGFVHYVGKAFQPEDRWKQHCKSKKNTPSSQWVRSLRTAGLKPSIEILEKIDFEHNEEWEEAERFWIECLRQYGCPLKNLDSGGNSGRRHCESTKAKMALAATGKKQSPELLARLSQIRRGRKLTEAHKLKLSIAGKGRPNPAAIALGKSFLGTKLSEEHKLKLKEAWKIRRLTPVSEATRAKLRLASIKAHSPECTKIRMESFHKTIAARRLVTLGGGA